MQMFLYSPLQGLLLACLPAQDLSQATMHALKSNVSRKSVRSAQQSVMISTDKRNTVLGILTVFWDYHMYILGTLEYYLRAHHRAACLSIKEIRPIWPAKVSVT